MYIQLWSKLLVLNKQEDIGEGWELPWSIAEKIILLSIDFTFEIMMSIGIDVYDKEPNVSFLSRYFINDIVRVTKVTWTAVDNH